MANNYITYNCTRIQVFFAELHLTPDRDVFDTGYCGDQFSLVLSYIMVVHTSKMACL